MMRLLSHALLLAFMFLAPLVANEQRDDILVRLSTDSRLLPLYLGHFAGGSTSLSKSYLTELESVLRFDLEHNGRTELLAVSDEKEAKLHSLPFEAAHKKEDWQDRQLFYLLKVCVNEKALAVRLVSLGSGTVKGLDELILSGQMSEDRRRIHALADLIHEALFGQKGIASTRILYTLRHASPPQGPGKRISEVWEADWDGKNAVQVTHEGCYCVMPSYLPPAPGHRPGSFFYVSYRTGQPKIYMKELKGGEARRFSTLRGNQLMPMASPGRDHVAFVSDAGGNPDLFLQPFSPEQGALGKPYQIFATPRGTQASPVFSPDGRRVAFVSNKDGPTRIYVMDIPPPGSRMRDLRPQLVTRINRENTSPSWSPDGTKLAYCSRADGVRQIWVYDFATGQEKALTQGRGHKENPSWAPDSLHLVFNSVAPGVSELYLVNLNQPKAIKISSGFGEKRFPCWEPLPKRA